STRAAGVAACVWCAGSVRSNAGSAGSWRRRGSRWAWRRPGDKRPAWPRRSRWRWSGGSAGPLASRRLPGPGRWPHLDGRLPAGAVRNRAWTGYPARYRAGQTADGWAHSSGVEHSPYKREAGGSKPPAPTTSEHVLILNKINREPQREPPV